MVDPAQVLREQQHLLAVEYGVGEPAPLEGEDLGDEDIVEVQHWIDVYSELVEFTRSLLEAASTESPGTGDATPEQPPKDHRALMLQAQVQELHLTYWVNRLNRLRAQSG